MKRNYKINVPIPRKSTREVERCITSVVECGPYIFTADVAGTLLISESTAFSNGETPLIDRNVLEKIGYENESDWTSCTTLHIESAQVVRVPDSNKNIVICIRVIMYHLVKVKSNEPVDPKKKATEESQAAIKCRFLVGDFVQWRPSNNQSEFTAQGIPDNRYNFKISNEIFLDKFTEDQVPLWWKSPAECISTDLALDSVFCSVVTKGSERCGKIYELEPVSMDFKDEVELHATETPDIGTQEQGQEASISPAAAAEEEPPRFEEQPHTPATIAVLAHKSPAVNALAISKLHIIPMSSIAKNDPSEQILIVCIPQQQPSAWFILGLQKKKTAPDERARAPTEVDPKKKGKEKESVEPLEFIPYAMYQKSSFNLTSKMTALSLNIHRNIMVVGQLDGVVNLYNLLDLSLVATVANHRKPITALWLFCVPNSGVFYIVSGSSNGTICFYSCASDTPSEFEMNFKKSLSSLKLIDFQFDIPGSPVLQILGSVRPGSAMTAPFILVQYACGKIGLYDYTRGTLIGCMEDTVREGFALMKLNLLTYGGIEDFRPVEEEDPSLSATQTQAQAAIDWGGMSAVDLVSSLHSHRVIGVTAGKNFHIMYMKQRSDGRNDVLMFTFAPTFPTNTEKSIKLNIMNAPLVPTQLVRTQSGKSKTDGTSRKSRLTKNLKEFSNYL